MKQRTIFQIIFSVSIFIICGLLPQTTARASAPNEVSCEAVVEASEAAAKVFVDGVAVGTTPVKVACKVKPQSIRVVSKSGEEFIRTFPGTSEFKPSDRWLNVQFTGIVNAENASRQTAGAIAPQISVAASQTSPMGMGNDSRIVQELVEIRKLLEKLVGQYPEMHNRASQLVETAKRAVAAATVVPPLAPTITRTAASVPMVLDSSKVLTGAYLQLHSLAKMDFDAPRVGREVAGFRQVIGDANVKFCKWQKTKDDIDWTRVLVGPFSNISVAKEAAKSVGRNSFVVTNPGCARQPAGG